MSSPFADPEKMMQAMDGVIEYINAIRSRLLAEGYSQEFADQITVVIFKQQWGSSTVREGAG